MIKIKGLGGAEELNGFMDESTEVVGELRFRNVFRIDGKVKGKIASENTLIVGEQAVIEADIDCAVVSVRGTITGRVRGRDRVELLAGSRVQGAVAAPRLVIEEGAFFQGECDMSATSKGQVVPLPARESSGS